MGRIEEEGRREWKIDWDEKEGMKERKGRKNGDGKRGRERGRIDENRRREEYSIRYSII